jgi:hypothetical protein
MNLRTTRAITSSGRRANGTMAWIGGTRAQTRFGPRRVENRNGEQVESEDEGQSTNTHHQAKGVAPSDQSGRRRRAGAKSLLELRKQLSGTPALAVAAGLQRFEDADEVLIADPLDLTDRQAARLLVRLSGDLFDEILIEVDDDGELGAHRAADRGS